MLNLIINLKIYNIKLHNKNFFTHFILLSLTKTEQKIKTGTEVMRRARRLDNAKFYYIYLLKITTYFHS